MILTQRAQELAGAYDQAASALFQAAATTADMDVAIAIKLDACKYASIALLQSQGYPLPEPLNLNSLALQIDKYLINQFTRFNEVSYILQVLQSREEGALIEAGTLYNNPDDYKSLFYAMYTYMQTIWRNPN